ncbi:GNAT family N-acetyltransferase [Psychromonas sp. PT13]|uniref:GNAT family N-acetyltransferase n=1 Tax=Psychromonas sp. PT13 TaxID=3439547 RepID=UPI003EBE6A32
MQLDWVEWFGYLASMVVLISLTMSSIIKLRVINLIGCLLFATFAYFIDSVPTMLMNICIALINAYFLWQMYYNKEQFIIITAPKDSEYFQHFLSINQKEVEEQVAIADLEKANTSFYMLRDNNVAGVLSGVLDKDGVFTIMLDYVLPRYRDFKLGGYFYNLHPEFMKEKGIHTLKTISEVPKHRFYLEKMGFEKHSDGTTQTYIKRL